jgi:hypothetical protein
MDTNLQRKNKRDLLNFRLIIICFLLTISTIGCGSRSNQPLEQRTPENSSITPELTILTPESTPETICPTLASVSSEIEIRPMSLTKTPASLIAGPTPEIPNYGTPPELENQMPKGLNCSKITSISPGPTWNGLQIGVSTYSEVLERLSPESVTWNSFLGCAQFTEHLGLGDDTWKFIRACFIGDTLSALDVNRLLGEYPSNLNCLLQEYGKPDRVTWGGNYWQRSLIWSEKGLLFVVEILDENDENPVFSLFLFSPIAYEEFEDSWLMNSFGEPEPISKEDPRWWYPPSPWLVEDPWGFNE